MRRRPSPGASARAPAAGARGGRAAPGGGCRHPRADRDRPGSVPHRRLRRDRPGAGRRGSRRRGRRPGGWAGRRRPGGHDRAGEEIAPAEGRIDADERQPGLGPGLAADRGAVGVGGQPGHQPRDRDDRRGPALATGEGEQVRRLRALGVQGDVLAGGEQPGAVAAGGQRPLRHVELDPAVFLGGDQFAAPALSGRPRTTRWPTSARRASGDAVRSQPAGGCPGPPG